MRGVSVLIIIKCQTNVFTVYNLSFIYTADVAGETDAANAEMSQQLAEVLVYKQDATNP